MPLYASVESPIIGEMMNGYLPTNQASWRSRFAPYSKFLLRWGWFVVLSIILMTVCSSLISDIPSADGYQATLRVQVQLPVGPGNPVNQNAATMFFSAFFVSSDTLSLALPELNKLQQFHGLQLSDLQALVKATPITDTNVVLLSALGDTAQNATILVTNVYQTLLQQVHNERSLVINGLNTALLSELKQVEDDLANSEALLQNLSATNKTSSSEYRLLSNLNSEQQHQANTINTLLVTLGYQGPGSNDFLGLSTSIPDIITVPGTGPTKNQRLALSPLVGLIMGLGGALLASRFSNSLPLRGKKRDRILPHIMEIFPVLPKLQDDRLQVLKQTASLSLPLLRRLRWQTSEHGKRLQLITVTSPKGREGKSTIASNLAIASAQSGLHTLLVDANPQRPVLHIWFQLPNTTGLLDIIHSLDGGLVGSSPLLSTSVTKLDLLTIGNADQEEVSEMLQEVLRVDELRSFIDLLCSQVDVIIFDGPSLLNDTNAANLAPLCDRVLLVVDAQRSKSTQVLEAETLLSEMGVSFATVLNRARSDSVE